MRFPLAVALFVALAGALTGCRSSADVPEVFLEEGPDALATLAVGVQRPDDLAGADSMFSRSAFLADGRGTFFYDELVRDQTDAAMGLVAGGYRVLDGWQWDFPLDTLTVRLTGRDRTAAVARPDFAARTYAERDTSGFVGKLINRVSGRPLKTLTERITLVDTMGVLLIRVPDSLGVVDFLPVVSDKAGDEYEVRQIGGSTLALARRDYLIGDGTRPVWLAASTSSGEALPDADEVPPATVRARGYSFGRLRLQTPATIAIATADSDTLAAARAAFALQNADALLERRQARMVNLLRETYVRTEDRRFDQALAWARLSLDALVTGDSARTWIMPGIPGAAATTGHAQMRAVGALMASGRWDDARDVLLTTTRAQRFDERIDIFGRAPSSYSVTGEPLFETTEATPLFVGAWGDYVRATGETGLIPPGGLNLWQKTVFAGRGLYDDRPRFGRQVGPEGFLRARAGDTWMQAESGGKAVIARDGFPVEAQGALGRYLRTMVDFAAVMGQSNSASGKWYADTLRALQRDLPGRFLSRDSLLADRLTREGRPDGTPRPNALYTLADLDLDPRVERAVARRTAETLVYPYGVSTLPQSDSTFHPYLNEASLYDPESALFAGTVWTALTGPLVQTLAETGGTAPAYTLTESLTGLLLDRGVVGAVAENVDAHPRRTDDGEEEPALGGAPVQPWTLAAYVQNAFGDYLGLRYDAENEAVLTPRLPESWGTTEARFRLGRSGFVSARLGMSGDELRVRLEPEGRLPENARVRVRAFGQEVLVPLTRAQGDSLTVTLDAREVVVTADRIEIDGDRAQPAGRYTALPASYWDDFAFAEPEIPEQYAIQLAVEEQRQLTDEQITSVNPVALPILSQTDPQTDDWGPTSLFQYPTSVPAGNLDIGFFEIAEDDSTFTFRIELVNAVPAAGTDGAPLILAIALDVADGGRTRIERGANYDFTPSNGFEYIIFIGDGMLIENKRGQEIGRLANVASIIDQENAVIAFSLPKFVIEDIPRRSRATLVTGALKPGGFVGEFAYVDYEAGETVGGGRRSDSEPNVYDVVESVVVR